MLRQTLGARLVVLLAAVAALVPAARGAPAAEGLSDTDLGASLR